MERQGDKYVMKWVKNMQLGKKLRYLYQQIHVWWLVLSYSLSFYDLLFSLLGSFFFFMEDNCFTILCWFLPFINLWYIYTMEYYSAITKNSVESVPVRWMNLDRAYYSEWSKSKEKDKYYILSGSKCGWDGPPQSNSSLWYF